MIGHLDRLAAVKSTRATHKARHHYHRHRIDHHRHPASVCTWVCASVFCCKSVAQLSSMATPATPWQQPPIYPLTPWEIGTYNHADATHNAHGHLNQCMLIIMAYGGSHLRARVSRAACWKPRGSSAVRARVALTLQRGDVTTHYFHGLT